MVYLGDGQDQSRCKRRNANTIWRKTAPPRGRSGNFIVHCFFKQEIYLRKPPLFFCKVPKDHMEEFMDVKKFNVFNTNNLWISMPAIQRVVREKALDMEIIVNPVIKHYCNIHGYDHETLEGDFTFGLNTRDFIIKLNTVLT